MYFIGLSYILVYISAVSMLFLFTLMLINIRISELHTNNYNSIILGIIVSVAFYIPLYNILSISSSKLNLFYNYIFNSVSDKWDGKLAFLTDISSIGNLIYTSYAIWLIVISVVLLLAMIGAIIITVSPNSNINTLPMLRKE